MSTRDRNLLVGMLVVALLGAFWFLALGPRREEAATLAEQVAAAQMQRDSATQQAALAQQAQDAFDEDYAAVAELGKAVPDEDDTASLLYQLQDAAGKSRVSLEALTTSGTNGAPAGNAAAANPAAPGAAAGPAGAGTLQFDLAFTGSYRDLQRLLERLQDFTRIDGERIRVGGRLLSIDGFTLATDPVRGVVKAQVTAKAYMVAPAVAAPATPAAPAAPATAPPPATASAAPPTSSAAVVAGG
jgi:hypothetical protein